MKTQRFLTGIICAALFMVSAAAMPVEYVGVMDLPPPLETVDDSTVATHTDFAGAMRYVVDLEVATPIPIAQALRPSSLPSDTSGSNLAIAQNQNFERCYN